MHEDHDVARPAVDDSAGTMVDSKDPPRPHLHTLGAQRRLRLLEWVHRAAWGWRSSPAAQAALGPARLALRRDAASALSGGRLNDLQKVVLESCCSVDRVDESLRTLMPLIPQAKYFRFNPTDARCEIELDATDRAQLESLRDATREYVEAEDARFAEACDALAPPGEDRPSGRGSGSGSRGDERNDTLARAEMGSRRGMLLVEAPRVEDEADDLGAAATAEFCLKRSIPFQRLDAARAARDAERAARTRAGSADAQTSHNAAFLGVDSVLRTASTRAGQIGVVHFACRADPLGLVLRWAEEMVAVAEPSAESAATPGFSAARSADAARITSTTEVSKILSKATMKHTRRNALCGEKRNNERDFMKTGGGVRVCASIASAAVSSDWLPIRRAGLSREVKGTCTTASRSGTPSKRRLPPDVDRAPLRAIVFSSSGSARSSVVGAANASASRSGGMANFLSFRSRSFRSTDSASAETSERFPGTFGTFEPSLPGCANLSEP